MARRKQRVTSRPALKHEKGVAPPPRDYDSMYSASLGLKILEEAAVLHTEAMDTFLGRQFDAAAKLFEDVSALMGGNDKPSALLKARARSFITNPPPAEWNGADVLKRKTG